MTPKISVIVPVYQAEQYMNRCIDSVLNQSFKDFDLILVDDGSKDRSGIICEEYAKNDKRITVIHKQNGGLSSARNAGLDIAKGEYIIFADPDDWAEKGWLETLYNTALRNSAELTICDFFADYQEGTVYCCQQPSALDAGTVITDLFQKLHGASWNKLIKRDCFEDSIRYPENVGPAEDLYINCKILKSNIKVSYVGEALYHYDQFSNNNSLVKHYDEKSYNADIRLFNLFLELFENSEEPERMRTSLATQITGRAFHAECFSNKEFKEKFSMFAPYLLKLEDKPRMIMLVLSSIGFYKPMLFMYKVIKKK